MTQRNIFLVYLFSILTFGIYYIYWYCSFQDQLKRETSEGFYGFFHFVLSVLTFGFYTIVWQFLAGKRLAKLGAQDYSVLYLVLFLLSLGFINIGLMQHQANHLYNKEVVILR